MNVKKIQTDAIVTWVDGSDVKHVEKRNRTLREPRNRAWHILPAGLAKHRFSDNGELRYCLYSIRKFMPWIRHIYLVTDDQIPSFLTEEIKNNLGIKIIFHSQIFRDHEEQLPTFNSQSIETAIHRVDGLAETYIYFNDDVLVLKPTPQSEFYQDGKIVVRGVWDSLKSYGHSRLLLSATLNKIYSTLNLRERSMALLPQYRAAKLAGMTTRLLRAPHVPHPVITKTLKNFFEKNPDQFKENIKYQFRSMLQFVPHPLATHLEIKSNNYIMSNDHDYIMLRFARKDTITGEIKTLVSGNYRFACLQGFEYANPTQKKEVLSFLDKTLIDGSST